MGLPGARGEKGDKGDRGLKGDKGDPGDTIRGPKGDSGNTILNGTSSPVDDLGNDGDFYMNTAAWMIYGPKQDGHWGSGTSLIAR